MPVNPNLDVNYGAGVQTNIDTALSTAKTAIEITIGVPLNLSDKERKETPSIDKEREIFAKKAVENLGPLYGNLIGPDITLARATNLWQFRNSNLEIKDRLLALVDIIDDANINAENIVLKFTEDLRDNAKRYKDRNVPGADIVWDELKDLNTHPSNEPPPGP